MHPLNPQLQHRQISSNPYIVMFVFSISNKLDGELCQKKSGEILLSFAFRLCRLIGETFSYFRLFIQIGQCLGILNCPFSRI